MKKPPKSKVEKVQRSAYTDARALLDMGAKKIDDKTVQGLLRIIDNFDLLVADLASIAETEGDRIMRGVTMPAERKRRL